MPYNTPSFTIESEEPEPPSTKSRTLLVLLMLVVAAATFSYLLAYAVPDSLIAAGVLSRWPDGVDPRPRRLGVAFASMMGLFLTLGVTARVLSARQIRRIDAMGDD